MAIVGVSVATMTGCMELAEAQTPQASVAKPAGTHAYTRENTALLIVDPYNDFMTEGGKL